MITLQNRIVRLVEAGLEEIPVEIRRDIVAISFYYWHENDQASLPRLSVSYNTRANVKARTPDGATGPSRGMASCAAEAEWNFAFWLQEQGSICEFGPSILDRRVMLGWRQTIGLPVTPESGHTDYEIFSTTIRKSFSGALVESSRSLHAREALPALLGRPVPIIIHDLEYGPDVVRLTWLANPPGLANSFVEWASRGSSSGLQNLPSTPPPLPGTPYASMAGFRRYALLSYGILTTRDIRAGLVEREEFAWALHEGGDPVGSLMLGDFYFTFKNSFLNRVDKAASFARTLVAEGFPRTMAREPKSDWDWYWLGTCHGYGRGTELDPTAAVECFRRAWEHGNEFAEFEMTWFSYVAGGGVFAAALRLGAIKGPLAPLAANGARILSLVCAGPAPVPGSDAHIQRIVELAEFRHIDLLHDAGKRKLIVEIEAELASGVDLLATQGDASSSLALYLIASGARRNPTGKPPDEWLRKAAVPEHEVLEMLVETGQLPSSHLAILAQIFHSNGWTGSRVGVAVMGRLPEIEDA